MKEEEIKDLKYLFEECKDIMEDGYATIKLSLVKKLFNYYNHYNRKDAKRKREFENLQFQIKEKEEVIKEAREYVNHSTKNIDESGMYVETYTKWKLVSDVLDDLLEILSKGENK